MPLDLKINLLSKLQSNLEIVKSRIKDKHIESWYSDMTNNT